MVISLKPELQKLVEEKVKAGLFHSTDELVNAALEQFMADDFAPGELEQLLAPAEADVAAGRLIDGDLVFQNIRTRSEQRRRNP